MAGTAIRLTLLPTISKKEAHHIAEALKETAERYKKI
jgi:hypothetical protein